MAETQNKAVMAERIADELFAELGWAARGPKNENYECVREEHERDTHPCDVVFHHDEPYSNAKKVVHCDLKSYGKSSIKKSQLETAIKSLSESVQCAQLSQSWQEYYKPVSKSFEIVGLLFLYNHDSQGIDAYDNVLEKVVKNPPKICKRAPVHVMGPSDIRYVSTIVNDLVRVRSLERFPNERANYSFYYPDLISHKVIGNHWEMPATLTQLVGPYQVVKYRHNLNSESEHGVIIYTKRSGESVEEFVYLLDFLSHYQLLQTCQRIDIRMPFLGDSAPANFQKAKDQYARYFPSSDELNKRLEKVSVAMVNKLTDHFSGPEIGME